MFDYGEAFTVVDVNTGRFTGTTKKLEDTILKNNLEAAVEVVRQLRLRDIGGIIVVDFIDMASQKNRDAVLEVLQRELKKDRSKVYVVEISPLGLVEMTRKNIADGVREIMTCECPTCEGTGRVLSDESLAIDMLRNLRRIARESKSEAFRVELEDGVARTLIGTGGAGLDELEFETGRAFDVVGRTDVPKDHFELLGEGTLAEIGAEAPPCAPGDELKLPILEPHRFVETDAVSRLSAGYEVQVAGGLPYVGTTQRLRIERATRFAAQAALLDVEPARPVAPPAAPADGRGHRRGRSRGQGLRHPRARAPRRRAARRRGPRAQAEAPHRRRAAAREGPLGERQRQREQRREWERRRARWRQEGLRRRSPPTTSRAMASRTARLPRIRARTARRRPSAVAAAVAAAAAGAAATARARRARTAPARSSRTARRPSPPCRSQPSPSAPRASPARHGRVSAAGAAAARAVAVAEAPPTGPRAPRGGDREPAPAVPAAREPAATPKPAAAAQGGSRHATRPARKSAARASSRASSGADRHPG